MSGDIWVYVELQAGQITPAAREALGEGKRLTEKRGLRLGAVLAQEIKGDPAELLQGFGIQVVYLVDHPDLHEYHYETFTGTFSQIVQAHNPILLLAASSSQTLDFFPRLAAHLGAPILTDCTQIDDAGGHFEFTRPVYGGMAAAVITTSAPPPYLATLLPGAVGMPAPLPANPPEIVHFSPDLQAVAMRTRRLSLTRAEPSQIDLHEAVIIVAGGRGANQPEDWILLDRLAKSLGGALGGSRPALDTGHIQRSRMIGQTGKNVRPRLYLAAGISGSTYHLRGVNTEHLLAINRDADAAILKACQCGVCADLRLVIPELIKRMT